MLRRGLFGSIAVAALLVLASGAVTLTSVGGASGATSPPGSGDAGAPGAGAGGSSAGCGKTPSLESGKHSIGDRSYVISVPDNYDNSHPYRLIFAFHWMGGTAENVSSGGSDGAKWAYYGMQEMSKGSAILVAPQGNGGGWSNGGGSDVAFVDDMLGEIEKSLCVNTGQVFAMGFSFGGGMSYALACARPEVFRAVAVYAGGQISGCDGVDKPIAYIGIHGINDGSLGSNGGQSLLDQFAKMNGCSTQDPPEATAGSGGHVVTALKGCKPGYPVVWASFDGGHTPGPIDGGGDGGDTWTKKVVWDFFSQF
jgi:poly(3-hydroxybutyrate) depolymerase